MSNDVVDRLGGQATILATLFRGLGFQRFRVEGLGFRVSGFRASLVFQGVGFRVSGFEDFRVSGLQGDSNGRVRGQRNESWARMKYILI